MERRQFLQSTVLRAAATTFDIAQTPATHLSFLHENNMSDPTCPYDIDMPWANLVGQIAQAGGLSVGGLQGEKMAAPGSCIELPRGVPHNFSNAAALPARVLVVLTPGVHDLEMFRHFDRAGRAGALTPQQISGLPRNTGSVSLTPGSRELLGANESH